MRVSGCWRFPTITSIDRIFPKSLKAGIQILERRAQIRIRKKDEITLSLATSRCEPQSLFHAFRDGSETTKWETDLAAFTRQSERPVFARLDDNDDFIGKVPQTPMFLRFAEEWQATAPLPCMRE